MIPRAKQTKFYSSVSVLRGNEAKKQSGPDHGEKLNKNIAEGFMR